MELGLLSLQLMAILKTHWVLITDRRENTNQHKSSQAKRESPVTATEPKLANSIDNGLCRSEMDL